MSCVIEILPQPMDATLIRLLGEFLPNTLAGTIVGKLAAKAVPTAVLAVLFKNFLRLMVDLCSFFIGIWLKQSYYIFYFFNVMDRALFCAFNANSVARKQ